MRVVLRAAIKYRYGCYVTANSKDCAFYMNYSDSPDETVFPDSSDDFSSSDEDDVPYTGRDSESDTTDTTDTSLSDELSIITDSESDTTSDSDVTDSSWSDEDNNNVAQYRYPWTSPAWTGSRIVFKLQCCIIAIAKYNILSVHQSPKLNQLRQFAKLLPKWNWRSVRRYLSSLVLYC